MWIDTNLGTWDSKPAWANRGYQQGEIRSKSGPADRYSTPRYEARAIFLIFHDAHLRDLKRKELTVYTVSIAISVRGADVTLVIKKAGHLRLVFASNAIATESLNS